jgi:hypothetical protein
MLLGLFLRQPALSQQLLNERVVLGHALQLSAAQPVGAAVADMRKGHLALADIGRRQRRAHARATRVTFRDGVNLGVGLAHRARQALRRAVSLLPGQAFCEMRDRELGGDLTGLRTAHAVSDHKHGGACEVGVLVGCALVPGIGARDVFGDADHHPSS